MFTAPPDLGNTTIRIVSNGVIAAAAGYYHSLYIDVNGALWAMGDNSKGQLGDDTIINRSTPVKILNSGVTAVAAGQYHSLFVKSDGSLEDSTPTSNSAPTSNNFILLTRQDSSYN